MMIMFWSRILYLTQTDNLKTCTRERKLLRITFFFFASMPCTRRALMVLICFEQ